MMAFKLRYLLQPHSTDGRSVIGIHFDPACW